MVDLKVALEVNRCTTPGYMAGAGEKERIKLSLHHIYGSAE